MLKNLRRKENAIKALWEGEEVQIALLSHTHWTFPDMDKTTRLAKEVDALGDQLVSRWAMGEQLHEIEEMATIYSINYRNAGWGMTFFERSRAPYPEYPKGPGGKRDERWRQGLITYNFYQTFEGMVDAEYKRLKTVRATAERRE
jgi:hypothetical protein